MSYERMSLLDALGDRPRCDTSKTSCDLRLVWVRFQEDGDELAVEEHPLVRELAVQVLVNATSVPMKPFAMHSSA